jgi:integrase
VGEIVHFCRASRMRTSEVCRLTWADLDTKGRSVIVRDSKHAQDNRRCPQVSSPL